MTGFIEQLTANIRRRKVLRVVAVYAVSIWVVLQVAEVTFEPLGIPAWAMRALVVVAILGIPISFILAWVVDIRPEGLIFDLPLWTADTQHPRPARTSDFVYAGLLVAALGAGAFTLVEHFTQPALPADAVNDVQVADPAPPNSIAVLAFDNFDGHADSDYFAAGLAEEILNLLAGYAELKVAARTSSFRFRQQQIDIREIAKLLRVRHVLEGSVRRAGNTMRVTAQLIDGSNGYHNWSQTFDRELEDVFAVQVEIAAAVVNELKLALTIDIEQPVLPKPTEDVDAYIFYLEGRGRLRSSMDADVVRTAAELFNKALAIDPSFSRAQAGVCEAYLRLYEISRAIEDFNTAEKACEVAMTQGQGPYTETHLALGKLYTYRGLLTPAAENLEKALTMDPANPDVYIAMGQLQAAQDSDQQAEIFFLRAIDQKRHYWAAHEALANFYYNTQRYEEAAQAYEMATNLAPDIASAFGGKGAAYRMLGETQKSLAAYEKSLELKPNRQAYTNMGLRYYYSGRFEDAVRMQQQALALAPDDHRVWGRLAESLRFATGKQAESQQAYERAAQLAESNLQVNAADWDTTGLLGLYLVHLDRPAEALELVQRAVAATERSADTLYYLALVQLQLGDDQAAIASLTEVVARDAQFSQIVASDPDLQSLRGNSGFDTLIESISLSISPSQPPI